MIDPPSTSRQQHLILHGDGTVLQSDNILFDATPYTCRPLQSDFHLLNGLLSIAQEYTAAQPLRFRAVAQPCASLSGYYDIELYGAADRLHCRIIDDTAHYQRLQAQQQARNAAALKASSSSAPHRPAWGQGREH